MKSLKLVVMVIIVSVLVMTKSHAVSYNGSDAGDYPDWAEEAFDPLNKDHLSIGSVI